MNNNFFAINLILTIVALGVLASARFGRPTWFRSFTTAWQYGQALTLYVALHLLVMLLFYSVMYRVISGFGTEVVSFPGTLLWPALTATIVFFAIPTIERFGGRIFQRVAGVPRPAFRLAKLLEGASLEARSETLKEARSILQHRGIGTNDSWLSLAQPAQELLLRATVLYVELRRWQDEQKYQTYIADAKNDLEMIRQRFDRLLLRVARTFRNVDRLGKIKFLLGTRGDRDPSTDDEIDTQTRSLLNDTLSGISTDISHFYRDACLLVARGVLATEYTGRSRASAISRLGFSIKSGDDTPSYRALVYAAVLLYIGVGLFSTIPSTASWLDRDTGISLSVLLLVITLSLLGPLVIAILPKMHWGFANSGLRQRTPIAFVVGAGIVAFLYVVVLNLMVGVLLLGGWGGGLARLYNTAPYLGSSFAFAAATAWLVQDHRWSTSSSAWVRRLRDSRTMGLVSMTSALVSSYFLYARFGESPISAGWLTSLLGSFIFGAVVGYVLPESFRNSPVSAARTERSMP